MIYEITLKCIMKFDIFSPFLCILYNMTHVRVKTKTPESEIVYFSHGCRLFSAMIFEICSVILTIPLRAKIESGL
jgi:hypothetical protein